MLMTSLALGEHWTKLLKTFQKLLAEYLKSGLEFNAAKSKFVLFSWKVLLPDGIVPENSKICMSAKSSNTAYQLPMLP